MAIVVLLFISPSLAETPATLNISMETGTADTGAWPILIHYTINDTGTGRVVMNINASDGRNIRHIDCGIKASGTYLATWDGRTDNGSLIEADSYSIVVNFTPDKYVVKAEWGGVGSADGQLSRPSDIAIDGNGNVYIAEYDNHRVQKFDSSGRFLGSWGGYGSGDGQLEYPAGIAVGDSGIVYVADLGNSRIEMFSDDGGYLGQWGRAGKGNGEFSMPHGIAIDGSGNVYVADMGNHRVQKFTATGQYLGSFGGYGKSDGLFMSPAGVTVSGNTVIVTDIDRNRVQSFTTDGTPVNGWGNTGSGTGYFNGPAGVTTDGGYIYVADMNNHRIQKFDLAGQYIETINTYGLGETLAVAPTGIAADGAGNIYVADISNNEIQKLFYDPARESLAVQESLNLTVGAPETTTEAAGVSALDTGIQSTAGSQGGSWPSTYCSFSGLTGNNGWYRSNVQVTLNVAAYSGIGIRETKYCFDNNTDPAKWMTYYGPFNVTNEGTTPLFYYSTDFAGNMEPVELTNIKIDKTLPTITGTIITQSAADGWIKGTATVRFQANDTLSGVANKTWDQTISANGVSNLVGTATDLAGNSATATVTIKIDNEPPATAISVSGGQTGWTNSDVKINFTAFDYESGVNSTLYSLDGGATWNPAGPIIISKDGRTTIEYYSTDAVGNVEPVESTSVQVDKTPPTITGHVDSSPNVNGWYTHAVTVSFTASDAGSGLASVSEPQTLNSDGAYQSVTGTATDSAGNTASAVIDGINIDESPPFTTCRLDGEAGGTGDNTWYRTNVTVNLLAKDMASGVHDTQYSLDGSNWFDYKPFDISDDTKPTTFYYKSKDNVNNGEQQKSMTVKIDKTAPVVTYQVLTDKNADGWYTKPVVIHFMATDDKSGVVSITPDITLSSNGANQSVTGYATDLAGNVGLVNVPGLNVDTSAPVTACILNRTPNEDGWFMDGDVSVTLANVSGLGTSTTRYSFDGVNWLTYTKPLTIHDQGNTVLYYYSTDNFSHQEPMNAENIRIDRTRPIIVGVPDRQADVVIGNDGWYTHNLTIHFKAYDQYSGIKSVTPDVVLVDANGKKVNGSATDMAGYSNSTAAGPFNVDSTPPVTTCVFNGTLGNNGWYKSSGGVRLNANDGDGIGVNFTMYRLDNGSWTRGDQLTIPDGSHTIAYYSVDDLNNTETVHSQTVKVDSKAPTIRGVTSIWATSYGWYNNSVTIHFIASDDVSGLASVSPDITLSNEGIGQSAIGTATDNAGNVATDNEFGYNINIDKTAPVTNYSLDGTAGQNGWNTSNVKVTFNMNDSSPLNTYHSLDNQHWSTSNPYQIYNEGSLTVYYYSKDKANNTEAVKSFNLKIDQTAPTVTYTVSGTHGLADAYRSDVAVGFAASDTVSGLANGYYSLDGATWTPMANFTLSAEGDYDVHYNATDNAGNTMTGEFQFTIDKTPPAVTSTTPATSSDGVYTDDQPIMALDGRLDPASINNSTVTLTSADGETINATLRYVETGKTSTLTVMPSGQLKPYTMYTVSLSTAVRDPSGNYLASPYTWTFMTGNMDSAGNELATPTPEPTIEPIPTPTPTPVPAGLPIIGNLPSIPVIPLVIFIAVLVVGGAAFVYFTRIKK